jgi:5'(3')-deoxyribonucleotidase
MIIGVDVDGVLRNFADSLIKEYKKAYPRDKVVQPPFWDVYPLHGYFPIGKGIYKFVFDEHAKEVYLNARPYTGAYSFMRQLRQQGHKVVIVSFQPNKSIEELTTKWLDEQEIERDAVVYTARKQDAGVDLLLDDCTDNLRSLEWTVGVAMNRPWNQDWKGNRVYDFEEFLNRLRGGKDVGKHS